MYTVSVEARFSAVHRVSLPDGGIERAHGHDWLVRVHFAADEREPPEDVAGAVLSGARDGMVYLLRGGNDSFVLRVSRDGKDKAGGATVYAAHNATANADGILATSNAHFAHSVNLYKPDFSKLAAVSDFLVSDQVGWDAPADVEVGASGDFYGLDQHRDRILRLTPAGKVVKSYTVPREPAGNAGLVYAFRVCEKAEALWVLSGRTLRCVGFDGNVRWKTETGLGGNTYEGTAGGFDVDDDGVLYVIESRSDVVRKFAADGRPAGELRLAMGDLKPSPSGPHISALRVSRGDVLVRRRHPTELFQCYDLADGSLKGAVSADHERLRVDLGKEVWTAGEPVDCRIEFDGGGRRISPRWRVWAAPLGTADYRELRLAGGRLEVPGDLAGLHKLKITPEVRPQQGGAACEYIVRTVVEVRRPGAAGSATAATRGGRLYFARGEEVPFSVIVRAADAGKVVPVVATLADGDRTLAEWRADVKLESTPAEWRADVKLESRPAEAKADAGAQVAAGTAAFALEKALTRKLRPGKYRIAVSAPGMTCVAQAIEIGPGAGPRSLDLIQYGDYGETFPSAKAWEAPDVVARDLARKRLLGFDLFVDRLGHSLQTGHVNEQAWKRAASEFADLRGRLEADPLAAAPESLAPAPPFLQTLAGYSAFGMREMAILMGNDAGLPLGTGFDKRKPDEMLGAIRTVTEALAAYPAFLGWSWSSNWWVFEKTGAAAARTPEEKAAYEAALKQAKETGAWDPVLDTVAGRWLAYAPDAQHRFNEALRKVAPGLRTAVACPYRNVASYPPISLANVDEVDLQAQWEQIGVPYHAAYNVDFYKRPGKRAWGHPEIWNDCGTGDQVVPAILQMVMRGADGVGCSGAVPPWTHPDTLPDDPRSSHYGYASVYRSLNGLLRAYGPWLAGLESADRVALVASGRMFKIDEWSGIMGRHFARLFEAYVTCLCGHYPASVVFAEDLAADGLKGFKIILLVDQRVELEPAVAEALRNAQAAGAAIFADRTCRPERVKGFRTLDVAFDKVEKDPNGAGDDAAYLRFRDYARANLPALRKAFGEVAPPAVDVNDDEVLVTERRAEDGRYVFAVSHTMPDLGPGEMWRVNLFLTSRVPVRLPIGLGKDAKYVYDALAMRALAPKDGVVEADLRYLPARVFAVLPEAIARVELRAPASAVTGGTIAWSAQVQDDRGRPIRAGVPVRVRLLGTDGAVLEERFAAAGSKGTAGTMGVPVNAPAGRWTLGATELLSGRTATLRLNVPVAPDATRKPVAEAPPAARPADRNDAEPPSPAENAFGPHIRDLVVIDGGKVAVCNTMNWDHNLYAVDLGKGRVIWRRRVGDYFAFAPQSLKAGFAVQGFDFRSAEGYHLYVADTAGKPERRFALYGIPNRLPHRFVPGILRDRANQFATADDGGWVASAGDLGLAVWSRKGDLLWSQDWWKMRRRAVFLAAVGPKSLLVVEGAKATAYGAVDGRRLWECELARTGEATGACLSRDGATLAIRATTDGGRVFILRGGKLVRAIPTPSNDAALTADGSLLVVVTADRLKVYSVENGLQWTMPGDDNLRFPRFSADDRRIAVTSDLGRAYVLNIDGQVLFEKDLGARAVPAWLPDGDLVLGTWMGTVVRLDGQYGERWRTLLRPEAADMRGRAHNDENVPTARVASWGNAEAEPADIGANLLAQTKALIRFVPSGDWGGRADLVHDPALLYDGKADPPPTPWIAWDKVGFFAETSEFNYLLIDTFTQQLRVDAITLFEPPRHPESWLRDAKLEYWDAAKEQWVFAQELLSNAAVHTHRLARPIEAARFRIVMPRGLCGNLWLGEIVLGGQVLGPSHPDVIAKRPAAVLFDDGEDLRSTLVQPHLGLSFQLEGAYSGGRFLALRGDAKVGTPFHPPFGHAIPNWDFEIAEHPQPGQYRYLQLAWKAASPETKAMVLRLGFEPVEVYAGTYAPPDGARGTKVADAPPREWTVVNVDLWEIYKKPVRIQTMGLAAEGGPAAFDQILLKRAAEVIPPAGK